MSVYQQRIRQLRIRMAMSGVLYVGFMIAAFSMGGLNDDVTQSQMGMTLLLLLASILLLPRAGLPAGRVSAPKTEEEADRLFIERSQLKKMEQLALYFRIGYLGVAVFILLLFPPMFGGLLD